MSIRPLLDRVVVRRKDEESTTASGIVLTGSAKEKPNANARTYGMQFIDYIPYFYRGVAYYQTGELDKAKADLETSQSFGEIQKTSRDKFESLQKFLAFFIIFRCNL